MINLTISEAMTAADGQLVHCEDPAYIGDMFIEGITLDSRKVKPDWLFIADKGERADGHDYVESARRSGAPQRLWSMNLTFRFRRSLLKTACAQCSALQATYAKRAA